MSHTFEKKKTSDGQSLSLWYSGIHSYVFSEFPTVSQISLELWRHLFSSDKSERGRMNS